MISVSTDALRRVRLAYQDLSLPLPSLLAQLPEADDGHSLSLEDHRAWLRDPAGQLWPAEVRVQLGLDVMHIWYHHADGYARYPQGLQVIRQHLCGEAGDQGLAHGACQLSGQPELLELDEAQGLARIRPRSPVCEAWGRGVLQGALDAAGDLLYSEVQWRDDVGEFRIRFVSESNRPHVRFAMGAAEETMIWRLRNRVRQLEQQNAYLLARGRGPETTAVSPNASSAWLDPVSGAVSETHLRDRLLSLTQGANPLPPRLCLLAYGLVKGIPNNAQIQRLGEVGQGLTRREDLLARLGSQGLALLLVDAELSTGQRIAARLKERLGAEFGQQLRCVVHAWEGGSVSSFLVGAKSQLIQSAG